MPRHAVLLLSCLLAASGCQRPGSTTAAPPSSPATGGGADAPEPAPPPETSIEDRIREKESLAEALAVAAPLMSDTTDELSDGGILLSKWAMTRLEWSDVAVSRNETSHALVQKDSDEARGKRMCVRGMIIQIAVQKTPFGKAYVGLMFSSSQDIFHFIAVGSTGELVSQSRARLCGVVTGKYQYSNSGGGTGHAVAVVGMFDLPENRRSGAEAAIDAE